MQPDLPLVLRLSGITKRFGSLVANEDISLDLCQGEILALLGENGAGKTTLMNILFGHYVADEGEIRVAGPDGILRPLPGGSPRAALDAGIGMVHQHFALAESLTVLENVVLGTHPLLSPTLRLP
jgi:general nucleoside transport system ATP-binding protein